MTEASDPSPNLKKLQRALTDRFPGKCPQSVRAQGVAGLLIGLAVVHGDLVTTLTRGTLFFVATLAD